jgi:hypothetical protein
MNRMTLFVLLLVCTSTILSASKKPFSKIVITSEKATCSKHKTDKNRMLVAYKNNVEIKLADGTSILSSELEIEFSNKELVSTSSSSSTKETTPLKTIRLKHDIHLTKGNKSILSDMAIIDIASSQCNLKGNVSITQNKAHTKDIPFKTKCSSALFNWNDETISFEGTKESPVISKLEIPEQNKHHKDLKHNEQNKSSSQRRSS